MKVIKQTVILNTTHTLQQKGFSLIEVMVSLLLISVGLLALIKLQTNNVHNTAIAYAETQSIIFSQEMVEHLRIDKGAAMNGDYNIALSAFSDLTANDLTSSFSEKARYNWFNNLNNALPNSKASIHCENTSLCIIEIQHDVASSTQKQTLAIIL